jgi:hypothetical protein
LKKIRIADFRFKAARLGAMQFVVSLFFALILVAPSLQDGSSASPSAGMSAATQPSHSALLLKKDTARAVLSAERRHGTKSRWNDLPDALIPVVFEPTRLASSGTLALGGSSSHPLQTYSSVFQARAPPSSTS